MPSRRSVLGTVSTIVTGSSLVPGLEGPFDRREDTEKDGNPEFRIPEAVLVDEAFAIELRGLPSNSTVTIEVWTDVEREWVEVQRWRSTATFEATDDGTVSTAEQAPIAGEYDSVDPMGLFWSMGTDTGSRSFPNRDHQITLTARIDGETVAETTVTRRFAADGVGEHPLEDQELVGRLLLPPGDEPAPAIVLTHGSIPYLPIREARLLAARGFVVVALQYFGDPEPLPDDLAEIPLEYFQRAIDVILAHDRTISSGVGFWGASKGGELALLLASHEDRIDAVVPEVPSDLVWQGFPGNWRYLDWDAARLDTSSWSIDGDPVPYVEYADSDELDDDALDERMRHGYERSEELTAAETIDRATIPVEEADASVLLVSAVEDSLWHSTVMADRVVDRLEAAEYPHEYGHVAYGGAGHFIQLPYLPTQGTIETDAGFDKTPASAARAGADRWSRLLEFFVEHLEGNVDPAAAGTVTPIEDPLVDRYRTPIFGTLLVFVLMGGLLLAIAFRRGVNRKADGVSERLETRWDDRQGLAVEDANAVTRLGRLVVWLNEPKPLFGLTLAFVALGSVLYTTQRFAAGALIFWYGAVLAGLKVSLQVGWSRLETLFGAESETEPGGSDAKIVVTIFVLLFVGMMTLILLESIVN